MGEWQFSHDNNNGEKHEQSSGMVRNITKER
jgi:hypothetical protein